MGKGITASTMAKSIKVIIHLFFMVISKTHFHKDAAYLLTRKPSRQENSTFLSQRYGTYKGGSEDKIGSKGGKELSSREHEAGARRFAWG